MRGIAFFAILLLSTAVSAKPIDPRIVGYFKASRGVTDSGQTSLTRANTSANPGNSTRRCVATPADILGPYYKAGVPLKSSSRSFCAPSTLPDTETQPVTNITFQGRLFGVGAKDCTKPLNGTAIKAQLEVWQADNGGEYDNIGTGCRTKLNIGANGTYSFKTIRPANYGIGSCLRPAHLHFRVTALGYRTLVTQVYFVGDRFLGDNDCVCGAGCKSGNPLLQTAVTCNNRTGACSGTFNIYLSKGVNV